MKLSALYMPRHTLKSESMEPLVAALMWFIPNEVNGKCTWIVKKCFNEKGFPFILKLKKRKWMQTYCNYDLPIWKQRMKQKCSNISTK